MYSPFLLNFELIQNLLNIESNVMNLTIIIKFYEFNF